ncbi:hypothetical protein GH714_021600 [Hevea brasiliensis]|uniref:Uncharacterized protein n=1 Tax=Hevea brasiliensis TaxID=3981 RepID=A0A6A6M6E1_HEVBR|nr:hypothetical protein GH714_021600 [Hevea brasiliensis]
MAASSFGTGPPPVFDGQNYQLWAVKMKTYLRGFDLWEVVETENCPPPLRANPTVTQLKHYVEESAKKYKSLSIIHAAVIETIFTRIMTCDTSKEAWDRLQEEFQGSEKTKQMQVLNLRREYELLKMKESEPVKEYTDRLMKIVNRIRYGPMFKTSLAGRPVSSDADFKYFILQQEGKLVELWYLDSFAELLGQNGKLLPKLEDMVNRALHDWTMYESVDVKHACSTIILDFTSKLLFGYEAEKRGESLSETFASFIQGLFSFPLNIPGTACHRRVQNQKKILKTIRETMEERRASPAKSSEDFLDHVMEDMKAQNSLTDDLVTFVIFALLLATSETIPSTLTLAIKLLTKHPLVMQELAKENEEIIRSRENKETSITWKEYKSMTFTMHDLGPNVRAKNFISFGGGMRSCGGAEFSKVLVAVFLHVFVTKYRWTNVKEGEIVRTSMLGFGAGHYIKVSKQPEMKPENGDYHL